MTGRAEELLTVREVMDQLRIKDRETVYRMIRDDELDGAMVGKRWLITRTSVDALIPNTPE